MRSKLVFALVLVLAAACSKSPDEPTFDNPFDPNGSAPGTGYGLEVVTGGQQVVMTWDNLSGVFSYDIYWSDTSDDLASMTLIEEQLEAPATTPKVQLIHEFFTAEKTNWYRIVGWEGVETGDPDFPFEAGRALEPSVAVALDIAAMVAPSGGITTTPTRFIELDVLTGVADSVEISNRRSFAGSVTIPVTPGQMGRIPWELATTLSEGGPAVGNNDDLQVHFRTRMAGSVGAADSSTIKVLFAPTLVVERGLRAQPGGFVMVDSLQTFSITSIAGQVMGSVVRNRLVDGSTTEYEFVEDVTPATLQDPVIVNWDPLTEAFRDNQLVSTMTSDFGFDASVVLLMKVPTALGDPTIEVVGGNFSTTRDIQVAVTSDQAGYVALSEEPDFAGTTFVAWADTLDYQLEDFFGTRFLYAAFSNPLLAETKVTSTLVSLVSPPARERP